MNGKHANNYLALIQLIAALAIVGFQTTAYANVIGNETQAFMQNCSGRDYATIESGRTMLRGETNISFYTNMNRNALPPTRNEFNEIVPSTTDSLQNADTGVCYGLTDTVEFGFTVSYLSHQQAGDTSNSGNRFSQTGLSNLLGQVKWNFAETETSQFALMLALGQSRIRNDPFVGQSADLAKTVQLVYSTDLGFSKMSINAGYRWAAKGAAIAGAVYKPVGNRTLASLGLMQNITGTRWSVSEEFFGSQRQQAVGLGVSATDFESIVSARYNYSPNLNLQAGGGVGLAEGLFSPDWRIMAGLNWRPDLHTDSMFGQKGPSAEQVAEIAALKAKLAAIEEANRLKAEQDAAAALAAQQAATLAAEQAAAVNIVPTVEEQKVVEQRKQDEIVIQQIVERIRVLHFDYKSANISKKDQTELKKLLKKLNRNHQTVELTLIGHTDSIGGAKYNRKLSIERSQSVADFLQDNGLRSSIEVALEGKGLSQPVRSNATERGRKENRRVEVEWKRHVASEVKGEG